MYATQMVRIAIPTAVVDPLMEHGQFIPRMMLTDQMIAEAVMRALVEQTVTEAEEIQKKFRVYKMLDDSTDALGEIQKDVKSLLFTASALFLAVANEQVIIDLNNENTDN